MFLRCLVPLGKGRRRQYRPNFYFSVSCIIDIVIVVVWIFSRLTRHKAECGMIGNVSRHEGCGQVSRQKTSSTATGKRETIQRIQRHARRRRRRRYCGSKIDAQQSVQLTGGCFTEETVRARTCHCAQSPGDRTCQRTVGLYAPLSRRGPILNAIGWRYPNVLVQAKATPILLEHRFRNRAHAVRVCRIVLC